MLEQTRKLFLYPGCELFFPVPAVHPSGEEEKDASAGQPSGGPRVQAVTRRMRKVIITEEPEGEDDDVMTGDASVGVDKGVGGFGGGSGGKEPVVDEQVRAQRLADLASKQRQVPTASTDVGPPTGVVIKPLKKKPKLSELVHRRTVVSPEKVRKALEGGSGGSGPPPVDVGLPNPPLTFEYPVGTFRDLETGDGQGQGDAGDKGGDVPASSAPQGPQIIDLEAGAGDQENPRESSFIDDLFEGGHRDLGGGEGVDFGEGDEGDGSGEGHRSPPKASGGERTPHRGGGGGRGGGHRFVRYAPAWGVAVGSRFSDLGVCQDWFDFSVPPGERTYQRGRRREALEDEIRGNFTNLVSSTGELLRECRYLREGRDEVEERGKFLGTRESEVRQEVGKLRWDLADAQNKLIAEVEAHKKARAEWVAACQKDNERLAASRTKVRDLESAQVGLQEGLRQSGEELKAEKARASELEATIKRLEAEKTQAVDEANIAKGFAEDAKVTVTELRGDLAWLLGQCISGVLDRTVNSPELTGCLADLLVASSNQGRVEGFQEGYALGRTGSPAEDFSLHGMDCKGEYETLMADFDNLTYPVVEQIAEFCKQDNGVRLLPAAFESEAEKDKPGSSSAAHDKGWSPL